LRNGLQRRPSRKASEAAQKTQDVMNLYWDEVEDEDEDEFLSKKKRKGREEDLFSATKRSPSLIDSSLRESWHWHDLDVDASFDEVLDAQLADARNKHAEIMERTSETLRKRRERLILHPLTWEVGIAGARIGTSFDTRRARQTRFAAALADSKAAIAPEIELFPVESLKGFEHLVEEVQDDQVQLLHALSEAYEEIDRLGLRLDPDEKSLLISTLDSIKGTTKQVSVKQLKEDFYQARIECLSETDFALSQKKFEEALHDREVITSVQNDGLRIVLRACEEKLRAKAEKFARVYIQ